jgi:hypothetical protein
VAAIWSIRLSIGTVVAVFRAHPPDEMAVNGRRGAGVSVRGAADGGEHG